MMFLIIILIVCVLFMFFIIKKWCNAVKIPKQSIVAFTGTLGSGKTYLAVSKAVSAYRKQRWKNKFYKIFSKIPIVRKRVVDWKYTATMYSNIPVKIGKNKISEVLTKEHLLERGLLPQKCVVLIDEIGALASQWDYDNPLVQEQMEKFIRFFRHWLDGKMFVTDQVADNIVKPIRSRLGVIYHLHDFKRFLRITPFYQVTTVPLLLIDDQTNAIESDTTYLDSYFFGILPLRKTKRNLKYQSRCYKPLYTQKGLRTIKEFEPNLYCRYLIDISVSNEIKKDYKQNKDKYKDYLYQSPLDRFKK